MDIINRILLGFKPKDFIHDIEKKIFTCTLENSYNEDYLFSLYYDDDIIEIVISDNKTYDNIKNNYYLIKKFNNNLPIGNLLYDSKLSKINFVVTLYFPDKLDNQCIVDLINYAKCIYAEYYMADLMITKINCDIIDTFEDDIKLVYPLKTLQCITKTIPLKISLQPYNEWLLVNYINNKMFWADINITNNILTIRFLLNSDNKYDKNISLNEMKRIEKIIINLLSIQ